MAPRKKQTKAKSTRVTSVKSIEAEQKSSVITPDSSLEVRRRVNRNRKFTYIVAFVLAIAGILYLSRNYYIAAIVNGQMITKLTLYQELDKQYGNQVINTLITKVLVEQEAKKRNLNVSTEEIDAEFKKIETNLASQGQNLDDVLKSQGMTRDEVTKQVRLQLLVQKMVADKVQVTDEEIAKYTEENKSFLPKDKTADELKQIAKESLTQEKESTEIQTLMQELRKNANIQPASLVANP